MRKEWTRFEQQRRATGTSWWSEPGTRKWQKIWVCHFILRARAQVEDRNCTLVSFIVKSTARRSRSPGDIDGHLFWNGGTTCPVWRAVVVSTGHSIAAGLHSKSARKQKRKLASVQSIRIRIGMWTGKQGEHQLEDGNVNELQTVWQLSFVPKLYIIFIALPLLLAYDLHIMSHNIIKERVATSVKLLVSHKKVQHNSPFPSGAQVSSQNIIAI